MRWRVYPILFLTLYAFPLLAGKNLSSRTIPLGVDHSHVLRDSYIPYYQIKRPKIALALSGGGARGFAQIGVLKAFEKHGLPIDGISGTSIGAIIGGLFAIGYTATEIEKLAYEIQWSDIIQDTPPRKQLFLSQKEDRSQYLVQLRLKGLALDIPSAYTSGQKLTTMIADLILNAPCPISDDFDLLHIPFRAVTTDLLTGRKVVLKTGSLIDALRASMAIPLLFTPVPTGNELLVDGGLVQNLPVHEAKTMGADLIIAVDTSSKLRSQKDMNVPWVIADQVTTIMQQDKIKEQLALSDMVIQPQLENISNTEFDQIETLIKAGEAAAELVIPQIEDALKRFSHHPDTLFSIRSISVDGLKHLDEERFDSYIDMDTVNLIPLSKIVWSGQSLFQTGYFKNVSASLKGATKTLVFHVQENPIVRDISISGNTLFPDSAIIGLLKTKCGHVLNTNQGRHDLRQIVQYYRDKGYVLAKIDFVHIDEGRLQIAIDEGRIGQIFLTGNHRTHPYVIRRELPLNEGDLFNVSFLKTGIQNIYSTGYFDDVRFRIQKIDHLNNLIFHLNEHGFTLIRTGLRYDLERSTKGFFQLVEENLFGYGYEGSLFALIGKYDNRMSARLKADRLFRTYMTFNSDLSWSEKTYRYYKDLKYTGRYRHSIKTMGLTVGLQMQRLGTLSIQIKSEDIQVDPVSGNSHLMDKYTARNLTICSEVDTRDRVPFPQNGKYHILEYETGGAFLGSDVSYMRIFSSMEFFQPLSHRLIFHPKIIWGTADLATPFSKQFHMGGLNSFMGLPEDALIGKRIITLSSEIRYRAPWLKWVNTYLSIRGYLGSVWNKYETITVKDFKLGLGIVLSFGTPLGPIHLGHGIMSDGVYHYYFSAGYTF